jgi:hypothetical protein
MKALKVKLHGTIISKNVDQMITILKEIPTDIKGKDLLYIIQEAWFTCCEFNLHKSIQAIWEASKGDLDVNMAREKGGGSYTTGETGLMASARGRSEWHMTNDDISHHIILDGDCNKLITIEFLIEKGADVNILRSYDNESAIHKYIRLLDVDKDHRYMGDNKITRIFTKAEQLIKDQGDILEALLKNAKPVTLDTPYKSTGRTMLMVLASVCATSYITEFNLKGANPNVECPDTGFVAYDYIGSSNTDPNSCIGTHSNMDEFDIQNTQSVLRDITDESLIIPDNLYGNMIRFFKDQDNVQMLTFYSAWLIELYKMLVGSLLIPFVPQFCEAWDETEEDHMCNFEENMWWWDAEPSEQFYLFSLIMNFLTMGVFFGLYLVEFMREQILVQHFDVNEELPMTAEAVAKRCEVLPQEIKDLMQGVTDAYKYFSYIAIVFNIINIVCSFIIIDIYSFGTQTYTTFFTNILFMCFKLMDVYNTVEAGDFIFLSAYMKTKIHFNDVDESEYGNALKAYALEARREELSDRTSAYKSLSSKDADTTGETGVEMGTATATGSAPVGRLSENGGNAFGTLLTQMSGSTKRRSLSGGNKNFKSAVQRQSFGIGRR